MEPRGETGTPKIETTRPLRESLARDPSWPGYLRLFAVEFIMLWRTDNRTSGEWIGARFHFSGQRAAPARGSAGAHFCDSGAAIGGTGERVVSSLPVMTALRIWLKRSVRVLGVWGIRIVLL